MILFAALCAGLLFAPLFTGLIARTRAFFAGRRGQPILQQYWDLGKLIRKAAVYSTGIGPVFTTAPLVQCLVPLLAACLMPLPGLPGAFAFPGDILVFAGLFALSRWYLAAAALDTGSPFEGMGASREVFFSALAEPVLLIALAALARQAHDTSLSGALDPAHAHTLIPSILIGTALFIVMLVENARIPFDDPATHLELTMIHEVMVLDHSGPDLALIEYGSSLKLWIFAALFVQTVLPRIPGDPRFTIAAGAAAMAVCAVCIGAVESSMARLRLLRVPQLLVGALACAVMGFAVSGYGG